jgi:hypothetical protein
MSQALSQDEWNGVYYDRQSGEFFIMDVGESEVTLVEAFTGSDYETLGEEEFRDCARDGDFEEVSGEVLEDPAEVVKNILFEAANAASGDQSGFDHYASADVDFAITATNLDFDSTAPYRSHIN